MKTPLAELKLRRDLAVLEVEMTEQRIELIDLLWHARQMILGNDVSPEIRKAWITQTSKYFP